jgi:hypothetical protein
MYTPTVGVLSLLLWRTEAIFIAEEITGSTSSVRRRANSGCLIAPNDAGHVDIPEGTTWLAERAFQDCTELKTITFPSSLAGMGRQVFRNCNKLTRLDFSGTSITAIRYQFCLACNKLEVLKLPPTVTIIEAMAFEYAYPLTFVDLESVTSLATIEK